MNQHDVYLCIGGNLGDRLVNLEETLTFIEFNFGDIVRVSGIYESPAWQMEEAPAFLNQVVHIRSELSPREILDEIHELEMAFGRQRSSDKYLNREMDVDVLFYDELEIDEDDIQIPHPRLHLRKFVLMPMSEIASDFIHPTLKKSIAQLLETCPDTNAVNLFHAL